LGLAREAEIHPGVEFNSALLLGAAAVLVVLVLSGAAISGWLATRSAPLGSVAVATSTRPGLLARLVMAGSIPLSAAVGLRYAFGSGEARRVAPVLPGLLGGVLAVAGLVAALSFGASLDHLVHTPSQQGWTWDVLVGNPNDSADLVAQGGALLATNPLVGACSAVGILGSIDIDGITVPQTLAIDQLKGSVHPSLLEGRGPSSPGEIALATHTLDLLHKQIGQTVKGTGPDGTPHTFRIVGRMVAPSVGDVLTNSLGDGAWIDASFVHQQWRSPSNPSGTPPDGTDVLTVFAVDLAPGASMPAAVDSLRKDFGPTVLQHLPAQDAVNLTSVSGLPYVLAALIALIGAATVGHALVNSVRRHRRQLAALKALGFVRRQVSATVACQATSIALVALALGIPLGLAGGRWAWMAVASGIYSESPPIVPAAAVAALVPAALLVTNAVAAWPAHTAGRLHAALGMRSE
jgi:hypothetical protein